MLLRFPPGPAVTAKDKKAIRDSAAFVCILPGLPLFPRPLVWLALGTLDPCYCSFHKAKVKPMTRAKTLWFIGKGSTSLLSSWLRWDREVEVQDPSGQSIS